ncbi:hypothetical protein [Secundilactobacillus yichangensis]|uniref:hypothetical protein n=1 Tax=Secundilactobacillus yichangensis TaxID=2799580 RepID=UPI00194110E3|nr:hypothetical protein [Secundilactobacillus yichangensis]
MKKVIGSLILGIAAVGVGFASQNTTTAKAAYRTIKTTSYASTTPAYHAKSLTTSTYMWNSTHTKKLHNLKNYPRTTWYLQKSVKLTNGKKTAIYYYLKNKSKSASGYVWHGYLAKGTNGNTDPNPSATLATRTSNATLQNQMRTLFPGTVHSTTLDKFANEDLTDSVLQDGTLTQQIQKALNVHDVYTIKVKGLTAPVTLAKIKTQLSRSTSVRKNEEVIKYNAGTHLSNFDSWYIGTNIVSSAGEDNPLAEVILAK